MASERFPYPISLARARSAARDEVTRGALDSCHDLMALLNEGSDDEIRERAKDLEAWLEILLEGVPDGEQEDV